MLSYTFQVSSCYFVAFIVFLRMSMVQNPMGFQELHKKITKPSCILIWILVGLLYSIPSACLTNNVIPDKIVQATLIYVRLHLGFTLPIVFSISVYMYLSIHLKNIKAPSNNWAKNEQNNKASLMKLINRLVIWMLVCNVPFIAWVYYNVNKGSGNWTKSEFMEISEVCPEKISIDDS